MEQEDAGGRLMYEDESMRLLKGDGYVRQCGGTDGTTVDVLVTEDAVAVEAGNLMAVLA